MARSLHRSSPARLSCCLYTILTVTLLPIVSLHAQSSTASSDPGLQGSNGANAAADGNAGSGGFGAGDSMPSWAGGSQFTPQVVPQGFGGRQSGIPGLSSLSQMASNLSRGLGPGQNGVPDTGQGAMPVSSQWIRGKLTLPLGSYLGSFRLSYQNPFLTQSLNQDLIGKLRPGTASATYTAPHSNGSKIDFSAAAQVRDGDMPGVMGGSANASAGNGGFISDQSGAPGSAAANGGQKGPAASVSLRLSF
jgi:hypothetical protein